MTVGVTIDNWTVADAAETVRNPEAWGESVRAGLDHITRLYLDIPTLGIQPGHHGAVVGLCEGRGVITVAEVEFQIVGPGLEPQIGFRGFCLVVAHDWDIVVWNIELFVAQLIAPGGGVNRLELEDCRGRDGGFGLRIGF